MAPRSAGRRRGRGPPWPRRARAGSCTSDFIVVLRTIVSSIRVPLAARTSRSGVYFSCTRSARFCPSMKRPADVTIAEQAFPRRGRPARKPSHRRAALPVSGTGTTMVSLFSEPCRGSVLLGQLLAERRPASGRRCARPACWRRWRSKSTREAMGRLARGAKTSLGAAGRHQTIIVRHECFAPRAKPAHCFFEWIYFASVAARWTSAAST